MKNLKLLIAVSLIFLVSAFAINKPTEWKIKDNYSVKYQEGRLVFGKDSMQASKWGTFKGLKASILFDETDLANSKITASVDARTASSGSPQMDVTIKGPNVLMADKFPLITFESKTITKVKNGYESIGKLTIKNMVEDIKLSFVFEKEIFSGGFTFQTRDFSFKQPGVPDEISVFFTIPVEK